VDPDSLISELDFLPPKRKFSPLLIEVIEMTAAGYDEKQIEKAHQVVASTVKHQMSDIYDRLGLNGKNTKGRNKRVMLAWWWWNIGSKTK